MSCQGDLLAISCSTGKTLKITGAYYLSDDVDRCDKTPRPNRLLNCERTDVLELLRDRCEGNIFCAFPVSNEFFGAPCIGNGNELIIDYECIEGKCHRRYDLIYN